MDTPVWALTIAYWLHMLATVCWIGGLTILALFILPAMHRSLAVQDYAALIGEIRRRLDPWSWFSLVVLLATGMLQMSANPNYSGFLAIDNRWAAAILLKHVLFLAMVAVSVYITWGLIPRMQRLSLRRARAEEANLQAETAKLLAQESLLIKINLVLGILVLALTAVARAA